jgi:flavin reductase (DIM6/NTAB) family NADH-FMN oxidoreductase RutF
MDSAKAGGVFDLVDRDLWLITSAADSRLGGFIATFVNEASIVPDMPRVLVGISRQHFTWELVEASNAFALHLLAEEHLGWVWRFGTHSGRDFDKFAGMTFRHGKTGSPILADAPAWLECRVEARLNTGDRTVYLAAVVAGERRRPVTPLTVKRLVQAAPADQLRQLDQLMARDIAVDRSAIQAWRQQQAANRSSANP